jgi:hypothetical protein
LFKNDLQKCVDLNLKAIGNLDILCNLYAIDHEADVECEGNSTLPRQSYLGEKRTCCRQNIDKSGAGGNSKFK